MIALTLLALAASAQATPTPTPAPPAGQAAAPSPDAMTPPPEFIGTAQAFGQCIGRTARAVPATMTPEAGAKQALAGCAAERAAMDTRFTAWVDGPAFPEAGRAIAKEQYTTQLGQVEGQVAGGIRQRRAQPPAPNATPTPAPSR